MDYNQKVRLNFPDSANVLDYGADREGVNDSSQAFIRAFNSLPRGGVISIPSGKYIVENIPCASGVYWRGVGIGNTSGLSGTYLVLPNSPSASMFVWNETGVSSGGGISYCLLQGNGTVTYDGIDLSLATEIHQFVIEHNSIRGFRNGYLGSVNDRSLVVQSNHFWLCSVGMYVTNNHPHLTTWNDFRDCTIGISGLLYDANLASQNFTYCGTGIASVSPTINTQRSRFTGCAFVYCTNDGIVAGDHSIITGCLFIPHTTSHAISGIRIIGRYITATGNSFDTDGGVYSEAAIVLDCDYGTKTLVGLNFSGNVFKVEGSDIFLHKTTGARDITSSSFVNNVVVDSRSFFRRYSSLGAMFYNTIVGNTLRYETATLAATLTGTITFTTASATVTGVGSAFLTQLKIGDLVRFTSDSDVTDWRRVSAIASDVSLTLSAVYGGAGGAGVGVSTRDAIHIHNNAGAGNVISNNTILMFPGTPSRYMWGVGGQLANSPVVGNYVRRGIGHIDTASSAGASIANNVYQA